MALSDTTNAILNELAGRIFSDFYRMTIGEGQPTDVALDLLEGLFQQTLTTLRPNLLSATRIYDWAIPNGVQDYQQIGCNSITDQLCVDTLLNPAADTSSSSRELPRIDDLFSIHTPPELLLTPDPADLVAKQKATGRTKKTDLQDRAKQIHSSAERIQYGVSKKLPIDSKYVPLLTFIIVSFGSPTVISQLCRTLPALNDKTQRSIPQESMSATELLTNIDRLENDGIATTILLRMYLAYLRRDYETRVSDLAGFKSTRGQSHSTIVLDAMCAEHEATSTDSRPHIWQTHRTTITNKLAAGKLWYQILTRFSIGGIALFSTDISNTSVKNLRDGDANIFMSMLDQRHTFLSQLCERVTCLLFSKSRHQIDTQFRSPQASCICDMAYDSDELLQAVSRL